MSEKKSRAAAIFFMASVISVYMFVNFQKAILVSIFDRMGSDFGVKAAGTMSFTATFMLVYSAMQLVTGQLVDRFGDKPDAMLDAGVAYATEQIVDLFANGVNAVHVYTMNRPEIGSRIMHNLRSIIGG